MTLDAPYYSGKQLRDLLGLPENTYRDHMKRNHCGIRDTYVQKDLGWMHKNTAALREYANQCAARPGKKSKPRPSS